MTKYNVLWIDDAIDSDPGLRIFIKQAEGEGIILFPYKSYEEAFEKFESKIFIYDAILLDASFFRSKNQVSGTDDLKGLAAAKEKITELRAKKYIPYFILSGQTRLEKDDTFSQTYGEYYRKHYQQDVIKLFKDIKEAADKQPLTQIRHKHQKVFDVCTEFIGEDASKSLMDILLSMENPYGNFDDKNYFNALRQIVELFFRASYRLGILHSDCINENGELNVANSKSFMSGKNSKTKKGDETIHIKSPKNYFPAILASNLESILIIANAGSHPSGKEKKIEKPTLSEYKEQIKSNYLLYSTTFQVMDLLLWFKNYADKNRNVEKNKSEWNQVE